MASSFNVLLSPSLTVAPICKVAYRVLTTWCVCCESWDKLSKSANPWKCAAGPIAAVRCYLKDMGFQAATFECWTRPGASHGVSQTQALLLRKSFESNSTRTDGRALPNKKPPRAENGLDWTIAKRMLKSFTHQDSDCCGMEQLGGMGGEVMPFAHTAVVVAPFSTRCMTGRD